MRSTEGGREDRLDGGGERREILVRQRRQALLQRQHVVAEQASERRVESEPARCIEERRRVAERVARQKQPPPVHVRALVLELFAHRP